MPCSKCLSENEDKVALRDCCNESPYRENAAKVNPLQTEESDGKGLGKKGKSILYVVLALMGIAIALYLFFPPPTGCEVEPKETVDEYSWEELSRISKLISSASEDSYINNTLQKYNLVTSEGTLDGTQVKNVELANGEIAQVQIAGFNHDEKSDGTGNAGITFIFKNAIDVHSMNQNDTNYGGWEKSGMRKWLSSDWISELPKELKDVLVEVKKLTDNNGTSGDDGSPTDVSTTLDTLWLYSPIELFGQVAWYSESIPYVDDIYNAEGAQYKLFHDMDVRNKSANQILEKSFDGEAVFWWGRSPNVGIQGFFFDVRQDGAPTNGSYAYSSYGVVPGFCI